MVDFILKMNQDAADSQSFFLRDENMVFRRLGEDMVLVPIRRGIGDFESFYVLNEVGGFIWQHLDQPRSKDELLQLILGEFDVSREDATNDLGDFFNQLLPLKALKQVGAEEIVQFKKAEGA